MRLSGVYFGVIFCFSMCYVKCFNINFLCLVGWGWNECDK